MRKGRVGLLALFGALLLLTSGTTGAALAQGAGGAAEAELEDADGNPVGEATFGEGPDGVIVDVALRSGQDALGPGAHGLHIHETGEISPDFEAAGEHFNPDDAQHGFQNPEGPHAGDLEEITVEEDGSASYRTVNDNVTLSEGERSLLDSDGSTLVIHAGSDDQETDPGGETGSRVAAGVIRLSQSGESTTPAKGADLPKSGGVSLVPTAILASAAAAAIGSAVLIGHLRRRRA